jgi:GTPase SAR1 family protein
MRDPANILKTLEPTLQRAAELQLQTAAEATTRLEVIDLTLEALGWPRSDFHPELRTPIGTYTDYLLKSHRDPLLVVEAKRIDDTFHIPQKYKKRRYQAQFLVNNCGESLREAMLQAAGYCNQTGALFAAVTNGAQWIVFRGLGSYRTSWLEHSAVVFASVDEIRQSFGEFVNLLGKEALVQGSLNDAFRQEDATIPGFVGRPSASVSEDERAIDSSLNKDALVLFRHYFDDIIGTDAGNMIQHCFVDDPRLHEYEKELQAILTEQKLVVGDGSTAAELSESALSEYIELPDVDHRGRIVLVVGRVGAGKTTFLHRFFGELEDKQGYARFILDLRTEARSVVQPGEREIERLSKIILDAISEAYHRRQGFGPEYDPYDGRTLRTVYGSLVRKLENGPKKTIYERDRDLFERDLADELTKAAQDTTDLLPRYIRYITRRTQRAFCLVFDNVDRASDAYQRMVYNFAQDLGRQIEGVIVLAMRDATFERGRRNGFLDTTNSDIVFQLQAANLKQIISKRLKYLKREAEDPKYTPRPLRKFLPELAQHGKFLRELLLGDDDSGLRLLTCVANRSIRRAFFVLERFFRANGAWNLHAGVTSGQHILRVLMLGHGGAYRMESSEIISVFRVPTEVRGSYTLALRLLAYLDWVNKIRESLRGSAVAEELVRDFESWGFPRSLVVRTLSVLVTAGLIESDQWFLDVPEDRPGTATGQGYELDYSHRLTLSPMGYFYLHDIPDDGLYAVACAGDTVWYQEDHFNEFMLEFEQCFSGRPTDPTDRAELLLASQCIDLWRKYLSAEVETELKSLAATGEIPWRKHIDGQLTRLQFQILELTRRRSDKPGAANTSTQIQLFELSDAVNLEEILAAMPLLPETLAWRGSKELPRIIWALELASRASLPPQTATELAAIITEHGRVRMHNTNVARLFRHQRDANADLWIETSRRARREYAISDGGRAAFQSIFVMASPSETAS